MVKMKHKSKIKFYQENSKWVFFIIIIDGNIWSKIDESAKDLIKKLLVVNPAERISA